MITRENLTRLEDLAARVAALDLDYFPLTTRMILEPLHQMTREHLMVFDQAFGEGDRN